MFSLVLPAKNEGKKLEKAVEEARKTLDGIPHEIILAESGSTDDTVAIARTLEKKYSDVKLIRTARGKGAAISEAFEKARGEKLGFMDVDLATNPRHLIELIRYLDGYELAVGSRYLSESKAKRSWKRGFFGRFYTLLARLLFGSKIMDYQCGFKGITKKAFMQIVKEIKASGFFWDTELLVLAQRHGFKIKEFPVEWTERKETTLNLWKTVPRMAVNLIELRLRLWFSR